MWRALSTFSLLRSPHVARRVSSSPVTFSSCRNLHAVRPEGSSRFFSNQAAVRRGDFDPAEDNPQGAVEMTYSESSEELVEHFSAEGGVATDNVHVQVNPEINPEQLENVLSLLQGTADGSLGSKLDSMQLLLQEEFMLKVLNTPHISSENLIRFFKWASLRKPSEFEVTPAVIGALVRAVCNGCPPKKDAYVLWDLVREVGEGLLDAKVLNELLAVFSRLGKGRAALEVLDKFAEFGLVPDSLSYYFTFDALCKRNSFELAWPVCERMLNSGMLPGAKEIGNMVSWLCKGRLAKCAHTIYLAAKEKGKLPPQSAMKFLIASLCREDETVKSAREMLGDFDQEDRRHAIRPFSAVIGGLCRSKDLDGAKKLLNNMIEAGPPPGNAVFNSVINGFSKAREMETAMEVKKIMEGRGLKPDLFTYSVIMSGFVGGGEMEEACKLLKEAKRKHKKLSPVMYHTLIRGYCKLEQFDKALGLLRDMKSFGVEPNADEYNKLIQTLCLKALDTETAEELLEEMKEGGLYLNGITRGLIKAVRELKDEEIAVEEPRIEAWIV